MDNNKDEEQIDLESIIIHAIHNYADHIRDREYHFNRVFHFVSQQLNKHSSDGRISHKTASILRKEIPQEYDKCLKEYFAATNNRLKGGNFLLQPKMKVRRTAQKHNKKIHPSKGRKNQREKTQRTKIKEYLTKEHADFPTNISINLSQLAEDIVDYLYPAKRGFERKRKIKSIRVELVNYRKSLNKGLTKM